MTDRELAPANCRLVDQGSPWHPICNPYVPITDTVLCLLPASRPWLLKSVRSRGRQIPMRNPMGRVVAFGPVFWSGVMDFHGQEKAKAFVTVHYMPHPEGKITKRLVPVGSDLVFFGPNGWDWRKLLPIPQKPSRAQKKRLPWI